MIHTYVAKLYAEMDKNNDDEISFDEFLTWFQKFVETKFGVTPAKK